MLRLVCLAVFVTAAAGQLVIDGLCDPTTIGYVTELNFTAILGTWNQIARINNEVGECSSLTFTGQYNANGELTGIRGTHVEFLDNVRTNQTSDLVIVADGVFSLNMPGFFVGPFVVQAIDYTNYGILYSCLQLTIANTNGSVNDTKRVWAWQYNRKATLSTSEQAAIQKIADVNPDLNGTEWKFVSHTKAACGDAGMPLAISKVLVILATLFISKEFI